MALLCCAAVVSRYPEIVSKGSIMGREHVILVHGLGESLVHMAVIEAALRAEGYGVSNLGYPSTAARTADLAERFLAPLIARLSEAPRLHFVTHSMGGIMVRHCLTRARPANLGRVVMTAPGNRGSAVLELYRRTPPFKLLFGPAGQETGLDGHCYACALPEHLGCDVGIIAGTLGFDPFASMVLRWPNDGRLDFESVRLDGMQDFTAVPAGHDMLMFHPMTAFQTLQFLRHGRFFRELDPRHYAELANDLFTLGRAGQAALPRAA